MHLQRNGIGTLALLAALQLPLAAGAQDVSGYTVAELLKPCLEGDNAAREGAVSEMECEQYIKGYTDAFLLVGGADQIAGVCLPDQNRDDEVRWAFMRWAYDNFEMRDLPASKGLLEAVKSRFTCP